MKRILFVMLASSFLLSTSCAHRSKQGPSDVVIINPDDASKTKAGDAAKPLPEKAGHDLAYTCLVAGDKRQVILDKSKERCTVQYTKFGEAKEVAWGQNTPSICQSAFDTIRKNIESAGFQCQGGLHLTPQKPLETARVE